jgi:signal peptidase
LIVARRCVQAAAIAVLVAAVGAMGFAWFAGWRLDVVESESMAPILHRNSVAVVVPVHGAAVREGDVIAFTDYSRGGQEVIHRVIAVVDHGQGRFYQTKGDANPTPDTWLVPAGAVAARMDLHVAHLGALTRVLAPPRGLILLVGVPLLFGAVAELRLRLRVRRHGQCPKCGGRPGPHAVFIRSDRALDVVHRNVLGLDRPGVGGFELVRRSASRRI